MIAVLCNGTLPVLAYISFFTDLPRIAYEGFQKVLRELAIDANTALYIPSNGSDRQTIARRQPGEAWKFIARGREHDMASSSRYFLFWLPCYCFLRQLSWLFCSQQRRFISSVACVCEWICLWCWWQALHTRRSTQQQARWMNGSFIRGKERNTHTQSSSGVVSTYHLTWVKGKMSNHTDIQTEQHHKVLLMKARPTSWRHGYWIMVWLIHGWQQTWCLKKTTKKKQIVGAKTCVSKISMKKGAK